MRCLLIFRPVFRHSAAASLLRAALLITVTGASICPAPIHAQSKPADTAPAVKTPALDSSDWPSFLGPLGTGVTKDSGLADRWPKAGPPVVWQQHIGTGYSAPSVRDGKLVVHHRQRNTSIVECLDAATGKPVWKHEYPSTFTDPYGYNNGPRCTPLLTPTRCYTFGAEGRLLCLDFQTGREVWTRDTTKDFYAPANFFGVGCTPILEGDLLIVLVGGQPSSGIVAFKAATGDIVWQSVGKPTWDGIDTDWPTEKKYRWTGEEMSVSYSSPIAATIHGKRQILCLMRQGLVSVDPQNGRVNFRYWFCSRDYESVSAARPVVVGDQILLSAAYKVGSALLAVTPACDGVKVVWRNRTNLLAHWSTPIYRDGYVYGFTGRHESEGELRCIELATGKVVWSTRGYEGETDQFGLDARTGQIRNRSTGEVIPYPFFGRGSLTQAGDRFLVLGERGTFALAQLSPQGYKEVARASYQDISYPVWPSPVVAGTKAYLRDENTLMCLELGRPH